MTEVKVDPSEHGLPSLVAHLKSFKARCGVLAFALLFLLPTFITVPFMLSDPTNPEGMIDYPNEVQMESDGFLMIILDGVGRNQLLDKTQFSGLDSVLGLPAVLEVETGPLTLSATCISELMTGVPNSPVDGLKNFDLGHPGGEDPWTLAQDDERFSVGFIGSYVIGNLYDSHRHIEFVNTFKGHGDFYEGDEDTEEVLQSWLDSGRHNVITAHFSGPDKVGHKWGVESKEYRQKMLDIDEMLERVLESVPSSWTVVVTADHGMTASGSHGSAEAITREVAALISGPDVIASSNSAVHQRDIPAFMSSVLKLPFPVQLHGKIPLEILRVTSDEKQILDEWNWQAAVERDTFYAQENSFSDSNLDTSEIRWTEISSDSTFIRSLDQLIALTAWSSVLVLSAIFIGKKSFSNPTFVKDYALFGGVIVFSLWSHINLSDYPMVPRFAGAALASALVAWPFISMQKGIAAEATDAFHFKRKIPYSGFSDLRAWVILLLVFMLITQDFSKSFAYVTVIWFLLLVADVLSLTEPKFPPTQSKKIHILLCFVALAFASLRLWFCLIPLFILSLRETISAMKRNASRPLLFSLVSLSVLVLVSLLAVHRRVFGRHLLLDFLRFGWPTSLNTWVFSITMLVVASMVSTYIVQKKLDWRVWCLTITWLLCGMLVQTKASTSLDLAFLATSLIGFVTLNYFLKVQSKPLIVRQTNMVILSGFVLLTWGAWAASITFLLLAILSNVVTHFLLRFDTSKGLLESPRVFMVLAVLPWVFWILWWTSLGQINGLQTCMEGICPHPRELDPGAVMVRGGYIGSRENPSTSWMTLMTVTPLILSSIAIFTEFRRHNIALHPFIICQIVLIFGCLNMFAFAADYPRLVFTLTWSILFSGFQILTASIAWFLSSRHMKIFPHTIRTIRSSTSEDQADSPVRVLI